MKIDDDAGWAPTEPELAWTYVPGRHEEGWLTEAIGAWVDDGTVEDVLFAVRGGKEANVYACRAGDGRLVAVKVYRPRKQRALTNDAIYREGRGLLDAHGNTLPARERRLHAAVRKGSRLGKAVTHVSWVKYEHRALCACFDAGVRVPAPIGATHNAVAMAFVGDEEGAAPTLDRVHLSSDDQRRVRALLLEDIERMLAIGWVHGDLSPYNVMYWDGQPTIIDLPQVCDLYRNPHAPQLFVRDVTRIWEGLGGRSEDQDARAVADAIWDQALDTEGGVPDRWDV